VQDLNAGVDLKMNSVSHFKTIIFFNKTTIYLKTIFYEYKNIVNITYNGIKL